MTNSAPQSDFQLECFRAANNRLLFRVSRRENWLKAQLLFQVALLALDMILVNNALDYILILSLPVSFILASLYVSEDRLVGHIVAYLNALAKNLFTAGEGFPNLESSQQAKNYVKTALPVRLLAQLSGFLILPLVITGLSLRSIMEWKPTYTAAAIASIVLGLVIAWLLTSTYQERIKKKD